MGCIVSKQNVRDNVQVNDVPRVEEGNYKLQHLLEITDTFSVDREIGRGGFGVVYEGILPDGGGVVAVKRLENSVSINDAKQFENEVSNLMGLDHANIVQLLGHCSGTRLRRRPRPDGGPANVEVDERLLCFEYLSNGNLHQLLDKTREFDWGVHFQIIKGISLGLRFLHEQAQNGPIVHLDLKPHNILLDGNMVPKIGDFGLSRLFGSDKTRTITGHVVGTRGYMAPEYLESGEITKAADVFSFGILILEVMTGEQRPSESTKLLIEQYTTEVHQNWSTFLQIRSRYPNLEPHCHKEVKGCIEIGLQCAEVDPQKRPTAGQIVYMLDKLPQLKDGQNFLFDPSSRKIGYTLSGRALNVMMALSPEASSSGTRPVPRSRFLDGPVCLRSNWHHLIGKIPTRDLEYEDETYQVYLVYRLSSPKKNTNKYESSITDPSGEVVDRRSVRFDKGAPKENTKVTRGEDLMLKLGEFVMKGNQTEGAVTAGVYDIDTTMAESLTILGMEFTPRPES